MAKEKLTKKDLVAQKDADKAQKQVQELNEDEMEALVGGASGLKTAAVVTSNTTTLPGSENPLCVCI